MGDSIAQVWCEKFPGRSADTGESLYNAYALGGPPHPVIVV